MLRITRTAAMGACAGLLGVLSITSVALAQGGIDPQPFLCECEPVKDCDGDLLTAHAHCQPGQMCSCTYTWTDGFGCVTSLVAECVNVS